jgi:hypothetical protein
MIEDYIELVKQLTSYYLEQFSQATCPTLAVKQEEVEIIKALLALVGGQGDTGDTGYMLECRERVLSQDARGLW